MIIENTQAYVDMCFSKYMKVALILLFCYWREKLLYLIYLSTRDERRATLTA